MRRLNLYEDPTLIFFIGGLFTVAIFGTLSYRATNTTIEMAEWVNHTNAVIAQVRSVATCIEKATLVQREFLLTGAPTSLKVAEETFPEIRQEISHLSDITSDNVGQQARIKELRSEVTHRIAILQEEISLRHMGATDRVIDSIRAKRESDAVNHIRESIAGIEEEERNLLNARTRAATQNGLRTRRLTVVGSIAAFVLLLVACLLLLRELKRRRVATQAARKSEAIATRALNVRSIFLANMSHEIRTPLHSIVGMADVLSDGINEVERLKCVAIIHRASNLLMNLINDVLDLSKMEAGKLTLDQTPFNLFELVDQTVDIIAFRASQKGLKLTHSVDPSAYPEMVGDAVRVRQILLNLLGNAIKFTATGGVSLDVTSTRIGETGCDLVRFIVADTGIGIGNDKKHLVFEQFNQLDPSVSRSYGGTGLGLTISRQLVELMHGRIWFESEAGKGTTFYVEISLERSRESEITAAALASLKDVRKLRILVADDVEDNRLLIQLYLKHTHYLLDFARNGDEAIEKWSHNNYDLILMDMHMPKLSGTEAISIMRRQESFSGRKPTPIIALTAYAFKEDSDRSLAAGCDRHLAKPITRDALLKAIVETVVHAEEQPGENLRQMIYLARNLEALVPGFLENRRLEISKLKTAIAQENFVEIDGLAHMMKGVAGTFGFQHLADLARSVQTAVQIRDLKKIGELRNAMEVSLENSQIVYI